MCVCAVYVSVGVCMCMCMCMCVLCGVYVVVVWGRVVVDNTFDGYELIVRRSPWPSGPCILSSWWGWGLLQIDVLG